MLDSFYYDETSPSCVRHKYDIIGGNGGIRFPAGTVAGSLNANGYWCVNKNYTSYKVHRIVLELFGLNTESNFVDHLDGDRSNNKIENLRLVDKKLNGRNQKLRSDSVSGVCGVQLTNNGQGNFYYKARYRDIVLNKEIVKNFSILKYGEKVAWELALAWRNQKIQEMNDLGAGYTERHGKEDK